MSTINHKHKHGFIHVPKTAGTSMERTPFVGGAGHASARSLRPEAPDYFWWGFVRHPAERLYSTYNAAVQCSHHWKFMDMVDNFRDFVLTLPEHHKTMPHTRPMADYLCDKNGQVLVDFVGRFENLEDDWRTVQKTIGIRPRPLQHVNGFPHPPWPEVYDQKMITMVHAVYSRDYEVFDYP